MDKHLLQQWLPLAILLVVVGLRMRSMAKARPLKPGALWILPALLLVIGVASLVAHPPSALGLSVCALTLAVGALIGWHRGKLTRIWRDPSTGTLMQQSSPAAMLLLLAIIGLRFAVRSYYGIDASAGSAMSAQALLVTDALLTFAIGLVAMTRIELGLRARRIDTEEALTA